MEDTEARRFQSRWFPWVAVFRGVGGGAAAVCQGSYWSARRVFLFWRDFTGFALLCGGETSYFFSEFEDANGLVGSGGRDKTASGGVDTPVRDLRGAVLL